jgi:predicted nucleotidyltransferase
MILYSDFKEFIQLLNKHKVKYLLVGGYAVSLYSRPKSTQDIDVFIESSMPNANKILKVLDEFGLASLEITVNDLTTNDRVVQLGVTPLRIDLMTSIEGVKFAKAYKNRTKITYWGVRNVSFISYKDLITNKKTVGRKKDIEDLEWLRTYAKEKKDD